MQLGADVVALDRVAVTFDKTGQDIERVGPEVLRILAGTKWVGDDRGAFESELNGRIIPQTRRIAGALAAIAEAVRRQAQQQRDASQGGGGGVWVPGGPFTPPFGPLWPPNIPLPTVDEVIEWLRGIDWAGIWKTFKDHVVKPILTALKLKMLWNFIRSGSLIRFLEAGGSFGIVQKVIGAVGARWFGGIGAAFALAMDIWNLIQQGNPIDAWNRDPGSYASDWAQTLFDASMLAFFIFPHPVTAIIAGVLGVVWIGTEIWDHWDSIVEGFNTGVEWIGDTWDDASEWAGDRWDELQDGWNVVAGGVQDWARDVPIIGGLF